MASNVGRFDGSSDIVPAMRALSRQWLSGWHQASAPHRLIEIAGSVIGECSLKDFVLAEFLLRGDVNSMKKELIAAHLTLSFAAHTGLTFRQSSAFLCLRSKNT